MRPPDYLDRIEDELALIVAEHDHHQRQERSVRRWLWTLYAVAVLLLLELLALAVVAGIVYDSPF